MEGTTNLPGDKAGAAGSGLRLERMRQKEMPLKKKRPRNGKIFMGSLGPISFPFCSFIFVINIYLIKKHSPAAPQRDSFKTLPIMITQIRAVD